MKKNIYFLNCLLLTTVLAACASNEPKEPPSPYSDSEQVLLDELRKKFTAGSYDAIIEDVTNKPEYQTGGVPFRTQSMKLLAFSQCVSKKVRDCTKTFDRILEIDPKFELEPAEAGHPSWGPVFAKEKANANIATTPDGKPKGSLRVVDPKTGKEIKLK